MKDKNDTNNIIIVGAGVAGLVAAIELEKQGFNPTIIEATDGIGGRVKTDYVDGYQFDHGFQVLLTAYPEISKYLDLASLNLKYFNPGAEIFTPSGPKLLADPLRQPSTAISMLLSSVATMGDKLKIWRLSEKLKKMNINQIFRSPSITTQKFLQDFGFSDRIISNFFNPFFSGIFLENDLNTSSRLFQFIFKMFSEGFAAVPEKGIQEIPNQLISQLKDTTLHFNKKINKVDPNYIYAGDEKWSYDRLLLTVPPSYVGLGNNPGDIKYKSTINVYFNLKKPLNGDYINLIPQGNGLVNNFCILSNVAKSYAPEGQSLLSVSVVGDTNLSESELVEKVVNELLGYEFISTSDDIDYLRSYRIKYALPIVDFPLMQAETGNYFIQDNIYVAGDYLLSGSLNAAMVSGREGVYAMLTH